MYRREQDRARSLNSVTSIIHPVMIQTIAIKECCMLVDFACDKNASIFTLVSDIKLGAHIKCVTSVLKAHGHKSTM